MLLCEVVIMSNYDVTLVYYDVTNIFKLGEI